VSNGIFWDEVILSEDSPSNFVVVIQSLKIIGKFGFEGMKNILT
jgi:hypothetical protein